MPPPLSRIDLSNIDFLLVDDNQFIRRLLKEILLGFGAVHVRESSSAEDAFDQILQRTPDLVLCDWIMYPTTGLEFLRRVRRNNGPHIPFIMITGHATSDHVAAAMGEGADSYIVKPFRVDTLMDHLVKVISATE